MALDRWWHAPALEAWRMWIAQDAIPIRASPAAGIGLPHSAPPEG